jgi:hypothetical protein
MKHLLSCDMKQLLTYIITCDNAHNFDAHSILTKSLSLTTGAGFSYQKTVRRVEAMDRTVLAFIPLMRSQVPSVRTLKLLVYEALSS